MLTARVVGGQPAECRDAPWSLLREALEQGDSDAISALVGEGGVSLSVDGIAPGSYTAAQAERLLGEFFRATSARRLDYRACGVSGEAGWAEAVLRYRRAGTDIETREHLLLEFDDVDGDAVLSGIRSSSPSSSKAP
ncbi:MAG: DUF4783 domain-containing protein [Candidatus Eisenbacteria bacterium]|nr:DUF4783 domain-containing protein [Candidatus Eisenbacteria bacterium]